MNIRKLIQKPGKKIIFSRTLRDHAVIDEKMEVLYTGNMMSCLLHLNQISTANLTSVLCN